MYIYSHSFHRIRFLGHKRAIVTHIRLLSAFHKTKNSFAVADARLLFRV